jgi:hypothetical protein
MTTTPTTPTPNRPIPKMNFMEFIRDLMKINQEPTNKKTTKKSARRRRSSSGRNTGK